MRGVDCAVSRARHVKEKFLNPAHLPGTRLRAPRAGFLFLVLAGSGSPVEPPVFALGLGLRSEAETNSNSRTVLRAL